MIRRLLVITLLLVLPAFADDPVSVEEAQTRLAQRIAERQHSPTTQPDPVTIEQLQDENRQLKAENAQLRAEIRKLKQTAATQPAVRRFEKIEIGMTRAELFTFIKNHRDRMRIVHDDHVALNMERVSVVYWGTSSVERWVLPPPGTSNRAERFTDPVVRSGSAVIALENGVVLTIAAGDR